MLEAINIIFMFAVFFIVCKGATDAFFNQDVILAVVLWVVYLYMIFSSALFRCRTIYERYNAEYYIDIEKRK